jgi:hypothetical protein
MTGAPEFLFGGPGFKAEMMVIHGSIGGFLQKKRLENCTKTELQTQ